MEVERSDASGERVVSFEITHRTAYAYETPVGFGRHIGMVRPRSGPNQRLISADLVVAPEPERVVWRSDPLENAIFETHFSRRADRLVFDMASSVEITPFPPLHEALASSALNHPFRYAAAEQALLEPTLADPGLGERARAWARAVRGDAHYTPTLELLGRLTSSIRREMRYERRETRGLQNPSETIERGSGACRDFALLAVCVLRQWRFAARFVSGFLHVPDYEPERVLGGGAMHAWAQVFLPGVGWFDLDPTNDRIGNQGLVSVAVGLEPDDLLTIAGSFVGRASAYRGMTIWVKVTKVEAEERLRAPELGRPIDLRLSAAAANGS